MSVQSLTVMRIMEENSWATISFYVIEDSLDRCSSARICRRAVIAGSVLKSSPLLSTSVNLDFTSQLSSMECYHDAAPVMTPGVTAHAKDNAALTLDYLFGSWLPSDLEASFNSETLVDLEVPLDLQDRFHSEQPVEPQTVLDIAHLSGDDDAVSRSRKQHSGRRRRKKQCPTK